MGSCYSQNMDARINLTLIVRVGCHLCVAAIDDCKKITAQFNEKHPDSPVNLYVQDIADQVEYQRFSDEVPILLINGEQVCKWRMDEKLIWKKLNSLT
jgi:hypothetical protein